MREISLDTETTGFDPETGDRLVEIGAVELMNYRPTGRTFHKYINPQRDVPEDAVRVHGLTYERLKSEPLFSDLADEFLDFIGDAKLVIHNAAFDMKFLNAELKWLNKPQIPYSRAIDTLDIARKKFPGSPASLDALCRRFGIDNSARVLHGALLDAEILAEVYFELIGGSQPDFGLAVSDRGSGSISQTGDQWRPSKRPTPIASRLTEEELTAHQEFVAKLGDAAVWKKYSSA